VTEPASAVRYTAPRLLLPSDEVGSFQCRSTEQTTWLQRSAGQSAAAGTTKVFVVTPSETQGVVAYYAWTMAQIDLGQAPSRMAKGAGHYAQPVALLARLGVHVDHEGCGLGAGLLTDAITRLLSISQEIGCRGLLIHAEGDEARDFYEHLLPGLERSPTDELHLLLLMKDARKTLGPLPN
jgi:hypothetical protein